MNARPFWRGFREGLEVAGLSLLIATVLLSSMAVGYCLSTLL